MELERLERAMIIELQELAVLQPLGVLEAPVDSVIDAGELYYFPVFKDTRLYLHSNKKFKLLDYSKHPDLIFQLID